MANENKNKIQIGRIRIILALLFAVEIIAVLFFLGVLSRDVSAGIGTPNATIKTNLTVGNVFPEILNLTISFGGAGIDLVANSTKLFNVGVIARDFNGEDDIQNVSITLFAAGTSYEDPNDNNNHYSNMSCEFDKNYGDAYEINATCYFSIWYYANNATWNVSVLVNDSASLTAFASTNITVNTLFAIGLPDTLDYGVVNATDMSSEKQVNITNYGNSRFNLSISGYAIYEGDNLAMNCTLGALKNISVYYEKYNLTMANNSRYIPHDQTENIYTNLSASPAIRLFNLNSRQDDNVNEAINMSYWRIYVPRGVAGTCSGNIIMGAIRAPGTND